MKNSLKVLSCIVFVTITLKAVSCNADFSYRGNDGDIVKQQRDVSGFDALEISGAFEVHLNQGSSESLTVEAESDLIDKIVTEVQGKTLKIHTERNCCKNAKTMTIYLTFKDLSFMDISGACELSNEGSMKLEKLGMEVSGASEIHFNMDLDKLDLNLSGASELEMEGRCEEVSLESSGASEITAEDFEVNRMTIDASGASECRVNVSDQLSVDVSGATSVKYKGNPQVMASKSGASSIKPY